MTDRGLGSQGPLVIPGSQGSEGIRGHSLTQRLLSDPWVREMWDREVRVTGVRQMWDREVRVMEVS